MHRYSCSPNRILDRFATLKFSALVHEQLTIRVWCTVQPVPAVSSCSRELRSRSRFSSVPPATTNQHSSFSSTVPGPRIQIRWLSSGFCAHTERDMSIWMTTTDCTSWECYYLHYLCIIRSLLNPISGCYCCCTNATPPSIEDHGSSIFDVDLLSLLLLHYHHLAVMIWKCIGNDVDWLSA